MEICLDVTETHYNPHSLTLPSAGTIYYRDSILPYLRLRVTAANGRYWYFDGWLRNNEERRHIKRKIGSAVEIGLPEARMYATEWQKNLREGEVPSTIKQRRLRTAPTRMKMSEIFKAYYENHVVLECKTAEEISNNFSRYFEPFFNLVHADLDPVFVQRWMNDLARNSGKATANKCFNILRAMLNYVVKNKLIRVTDNPLDGVKPFRIENEIIYLKQGEQAERLKATLEDAHEDVRDVVMLLLLTCQRKRNVIDMMWCEIDFQAHQWNVPPHKTKSGKAYAVSLTDRAIEILQRRQESATTDRVFNRVTIDAAWRKVRKRAGLEHLKLHSMRHTSATWLAHSGASAHTIMRALHHANISTSLKYISLTSSDVLPSLEISQKSI